MRKTKVVIIGAGSASFGPGLLCDAFHCRALEGSPLVLVDTDAEALETMANLARQMNERSAVKLKIEHTTNRREALPDAEFVITCVAIRRNELWKLDWEIGRKYGIRQVLGENGGPGGLSHSLRNIPVILDICGDMERLCPDALLINFTNPESRVCMAVDRYSRIECVGLCHGFFMSIDSISRITGIDAREIDGKAAGLNHFTWFTELWRKSTGEDLYPLLQKKALTCDPKFLPLSLELLDKFGLFPSPSDDHIGEYLPYAWEKCGLHGYDFDQADRERRELWKIVTEIARGEMPVDSLLARPSGEIAFDIIRAILTNSNELMPAVNIPNEGCITNLPREAIVEVPALANASGICGLSIGELPKAIAALCEHQVRVQELVVEAAATGSRELALQALLIDPVVHSLEAARKTLDELLWAHAPYLPQFG